MLKNMSITIGFKKFKDFQKNKVTSVILVLLFLSVQAKADSKPSVFYYGIENFDRSQFSKVASIGRGQVGKVTVINPYARSAKISIGNARFFAFEEESFFSIVTTEGGVANIRIYPESNFLYFEVNQEYSDPLQGNIQVLVVYKMLSTSLIPPSRGYSQSDSAVINFSRPGNVDEIHIFSPERVENHLELLIDQHNRMALINNAESIR